MITFLKQQAEAEVMNKKHVRKIIELARKHDVKLASVIHGEFTAEGEAARVRAFMQELAAL